MILMMAGLLLFFAPHLFSTFRDARASAIERLGAGTYKGIYSVLSIIGLVMIGYGYGDWRASGPALLWDPPVATRHIALLLMLLSTLAIGAYLVPSHLRAWLKHPMLVAVKLWALAHLLANGDAATTTLAGAFLAYAVYDRISVKRRGEALPQAPKGWTGDLVAVVVGVVLYAALAFWFHPAVVGVPVMG